MEHHCQRSWNHEQWNPFLKCWQQIIKWCTQQWAWHWHGSSVIVHQLICTRRSSLTGGRMEKGRLHWEITSAPLDVRQKRPLWIDQLSSSFRIENNFHPSSIVVRRCGSCRTRYPSARTTSRSAGSSTRLQSATSQTTTPDIKRSALFLIHVDFMQFKF